jgi:hypothetical protein
MMYFTTKIIKELVKRPASRKCHATRRSATIFVEICQTRCQPQVPRHASLLAAQKRKPAPQSAQAFRDTRLT